MRFLILGPLEVAGEGGEALPISRSKERVILACLIAHAGRVATIDALIDAVWRDDPPKTAEKTLGSHISRLRSALRSGDASDSRREVLVGRAGGYVLQVEDEEVDALQFERSAARGHELVESGDLEAGAATLEEALRLWRGTAFQEFRDTGFGASEGERLEELRRTAAEDLIDARLGLGVSATLVSNLEAMVRDEPLRERRWGQLMLALHGAGRRAEALQAYARARSVIVEEIGIEPGAELRELQKAILTADPTLEQRSRLRRSEVVRTLNVCPYKGLARFEAADAEFFFGREEAVAETVARLVDGRSLALVGASGSGKSSLMRAGLLHALASGAIPGSERWTYVLARPGEHPLEALTSSVEGALPAGSIEGTDRWLPRLAASNPGSRIVIAIDQFEEIFTACRDAAERTAFLDALTHAAMVPDSAVTVILAMRADYYGRCAEHRPLASLLGSGQILVGPMHRDELRRAIELPAERAGLKVEVELADALVTDSVDQPGALPLLSTALLELWTRRRGPVLSIEDYRRTGGVQGAVARLAEDAFIRLDDPSQAAARRILMRLATSDEGSNVVRRRASLTEFDLERDVDASRALAVLTDARLVTVADGTAEVAHEALLRDWPRLGTWLEEDAEGRKLHRHVTESAVAWDEGGREDGDLYRGARLTAALDWAQVHGEANDLERVFLDRSRTASEGEAFRTRRMNRLLRGLLAGVAALLALSLLVGSLALKQRDQAQAAADVADGRQLAARSLTEKDGIVSLLLARQAVSLDDSAQTRSALLAALQREPAAIAEMHATGAAPGDLTQWLRLSPDGRVIATGGARTTVTLFDARTYQPLRRIDVGARTTSASFGPDGGTLAVAAGDRVVGVDVRTRAIGSSVTTNGRTVEAVLFTPEGDLLTAESNGQHTFLVPRDPATFEPSGTPVRSASGPITAMASSADGRFLVTTGLPPTYAIPGGHTAVWDEHDLAQVSGPFPIGGHDIAVSPDGRTAAIAAAESEDRGQGDSLKGRLVLLNLRTGRERISRIGTTSGVGPPIGLTGVTFSDDGRSVLSTGDDGRILIWSAASATVEHAFRDPSGLVTFAPALEDDRTAFTIDADGNVVAWDLAGDRRIGRSFIAGSGATSTGFSWPYFAISPDGRTLAIVQASDYKGPGSVRLVDAATLTGLGVIPYDGIRYPQFVTFSPDGRTLAVTSFDGYIRLWNVDTREPEGTSFRVPGSASPAIDFWAAAFSPDGSLLATAGSASWHPANSRGVVYLWDAASGDLVDRLPEPAQWVNLVSFTPDGTRLLAATGINGVGNVIVWNLKQERVERTIPADDAGVFWIDISNDGTTLVTAGQSYRERLFSLATGRPIGSPLTGPNRTVDLSPDGRTLVAAGPVPGGPPGEVIMWDVATGAVLGRSWFPDIRATGDLAAGFSPDGRRLFIVSETGEAWVWDVDPASWERRACQIAGRNLTVTEWQLYLPDRPYQATCGA
jgi:WD40 repeat protein/DNA-binding SARP family transcriptional activator